MPRAASSWRTRLRGRLHWLVIIAALGALAGAGIGWWTGEALYRSTASVEIHASFDDVVNPAERRNAEALADSHAARQVELLRSRPVVEAAIAGRRWPDDPLLREASRVREHLTVERPANQPRRIVASLLARDPRLAANALDEILRAYEAAYHIDQQSTAAHLENHRRMQRDLETRLADIARRMREAAPAAGTIGLDHLIATRNDEYRRLQETLSQTRLALAAVVEVEAPDDPAAREMFVDRLAQQDAVLQGLRREQAAALDRLASLRRRMGPNAPEILDTHDLIRRLDARIDERLRLARSGAVTPAGEEDGIALTADDLRKREAQLVRRQTQLEEELGRYERAKATLRDLEAQADEVRRNIEGAYAEADRLELRRRVTGELRVADWASTVSSPSFDSRPRNAAIGAALGTLPALLVPPFFMLLDRRLRRPQNLTVGATTTAPLFGTVPTVDNDDDTGAADVTALAIHEIRALMQIRARAEGARAFAITSPARGAGKTSLTVGLASSLALSGTRTLLVDCDLVGRVNAPGQGGFSRPENQHNKAPEKQNLDQVMLQMGYLDGNDPEIMLLSHDAGVGITGMLDGAPLNRCVIETSVPGLAVLPALSATAQHIGRMSSQFIRRLIDEALQSYDMIIFDTGPVPGSVEALMVTSEADATILVVQRGELRSRFERTIAYLNVVGARLAGTVFNRAKDDDLSVQVGVLEPKKRRHPKETAPAEEAANRAYARQITGSGLLAAAVHTQANVAIGSERDRASRRDENARRRTPPQPSRSAAPDHVSLDDTGEIAAVLREPAPGPANGKPARPPRPEAPRQPAPSPAGNRPAVTHPAVGDIDLEQALDELVKDARTAGPPADRPAPQPARPAGQRPAPRPGSNPGNGGNPRPPAV